jgi:bacteriorhodopsin
MMKFALVCVLVCVANAEYSLPSLNPFGAPAPVKDDDAERLDFGPDVDGSIPTPQPTPHPTNKPKPKAKAKPVKHSKDKKVVDTCAKKVAKNGLSDQGQKYLWGGFFGMAIPAAYFAHSTFAVADGSRKYHIVTTFICLIASLAYLAMATGNGVYVRSFDCREFFYARYIDWAVTTPLLLIDLLGFAGASSDTTNLLIGADFLMIIAGLIGAFFEGQEKYYFWGFGMLMFAPIIYYLNELKTSPACTSSTKIGGLYGKICNLTIVTWCIYPIVWICAEGNGNITADQEAMAYTILDVCAKSGFGFLIIQARVHEPDSSATVVTTTAVAAASTKADKPTTPLEDAGSML